MAVATAKALDLQVCGVDILSSKRGPLVLEVNSTPGLEGIQTATGVDVVRKNYSIYRTAKKIIVLFLWHITIQIWLFLVKK